MNILLILLYYLLYREIYVFRVKGLLFLGIVSINWFIPFSPFWRGFFVRTESLSLLWIISVWSVRKAYCSRTVVGNFLKNWLNNFFGKILYFFWTLLNFLDILMSLLHVLEMLEINFLKWNLIFLLTPLVAIMMLGFWSFGMTFF